VTEVSARREHHGCACGIDRLDHLVVAGRAAGLGDPAASRLGSATPRRRGSSSITAGPRSIAATMFHPALERRAVADDLVPHLAVAGRA